MGEVLKGCPFCGGTAHLLVREHDRTHYTGEYEGQVECLTCEATAGYSKEVGRDETAIAAIAAWNRRTPPDAGRHGEE